LGVSPCESRTPPGKRREDSESCPFSFGIIFHEKELDFWKTYNEKGGCRTDTSFYIDKHHLNKF
ncbi:hypothetical protein, partial [Domibacillus sp.]|uniref:hypothetical protein n=1 Tax=Domibacillus sp. TaxID=1969783 RepID=UPI0028110258